MSFKIITDINNTKTSINTEDINQVYKDTHEDCLIIERAKFNYPHNEIRLKGGLKSFTEFLNSDNIEYNPEAANT